MSGPKQYLKSRLTTALPCRSRAGAHVAQEKDSGVGVGQGGCRIRTHQVLQSAESDSTRISPKAATFEIAAE